MKLTHLIITIVVIALGIYDLAVVLISGTAGSISQVMVDLRLTSPYVIFTWGFIMGHFFGVMPPSPAALKKYWDSRKKK